MTDRHTMIERYLEGTLPPDQAAEFAEMILGDPSAVDALVESAAVDDLLRERLESRREGAGIEKLTATPQGQVCLECPVPSAPPARSAPRTLPLRRTALAGVAVMSLAATWLLSGWFAAPAEPRPPAATFARSANVQWQEGAHRWSVGEILREGDEIRISGGRIELIFESNAVMTLAGPAAIQIHSRLVTLLHYGTATTRVENVKSGEFRVLTPSTEVIDLGTHFGVKVEPNGETDVVVFEGEVDLIPGSWQRSRGTGAPRRRLAIGEGLRVNRAGAWERIVSVDNDAYPFGDQMFQFSPARSPVIAGVSDDRRSASSPKFYHIRHGGLGEDVKAFVDRPFEWNGVTADGMPPFLLGADYVQTFNDDKDQQCPLITVQVARPCMLYVFYDDRMVVPEWLSENFEDTGRKIGLDEGVRSIGVGPGVSIDQTCSVWQRRIETPGDVQLGLIGDVKDPDAARLYPSKRTMFGIAAQPLEN